jgi:hypothetical protein
VIDMPVSTERTSAMPAIDSATITISAMNSTTPDCARRAGSGGRVGLMVSGSTSDCAAG